VRLGRDDTGRWKITPDRYEDVGRMKDQPPADLGIPGDADPVVAGTRVPQLDDRGGARPRGRRADAAAVGGGGARCARTILTQTPQERTFCVSYEYTS